MECVVGGLAGVGVDCGEMVVVEDEEAGDGNCGWREF